MKKLFLTAFTLACLNAPAQYFQGVYGTPESDLLRSGVNTIQQGPGHFMAGFTRLSCLQPLATIPAAFTDINGAVPSAPYFSRNYIISRFNGPTLFAMNPQVFEMDNGAGFGIVGNYIDFTQPSPDNQGIFYLQLDGAGNPVAIFDYVLSSSGYGVGIVNGIAESVYSSGGNELYITGGVTDNLNTYPFVLKIDVASGAINWGEVYDMLPNSNTYEPGRAVCESPYTPFGQPEIVIVGSAVDFSIAGTTTDGYLMHIDANTGAPLAPATFYGTNASNEEFSSIRVAANTNAGPAGFVIGGSTTSTAGGDFDFWVLNTDDAGNVNWASIFDFSASPNSYNVCSDVIERFNTNGQWEYYAVGQTQNGIFGNSDVQVVKIDEMGNGVAGGEFIYGGPNVDIGQMLDQDNAAGSAPPDGLSIYSWWGGATSGPATIDLYLIKAYFNGLSGCNEWFGNPAQNSGPGILSSVNVSTVVNFTQANLAVSYMPASDALLCYNTTIPGGNNARIAPAEDKNNTGLQLMPNPAVNENIKVQVEVESNASAPAHVAVYDMMGKQVYNGTAELTKGKNKIPLEMKAGIAAGVYNVVVTQGERVQSTMLMIK